MEEPQVAVKQETGDTFTFAKESNEDNEQTPEIVEIKVDPELYEPVNLDQDSNLSGEDEPIGNNDKEKLGRRRSSRSLRPKRNRVGAAANKIQKKPKNAFNFSCDHCDYKTNKERFLKSHVKQHNKHRIMIMFKCEFCEFETMHKDSIKRHMVKHKKVEEADMYICSQCDYKTVYKPNFKRHMLKHKNPDEVNVYKCDQCDYQAIHKHNLKSHALKHKSPGEVDFYKCNQCDYETVIKKNLTDHVLKHENAEEDDFDTCQIVHRSDLSSHISNENSDLYKCDQCDYQTTHKDSLRYHTLMHRNPNEGDRNKCNQCDYQTDHKNDYQTHILGHKNGYKVKLYKDEKNASNSVSVKVIGVSGKKRSAIKGGRAWASSRSKYILPDLLN